MDVLELAVPADMASHKFMGSEGFRDNTGGSEGCVSSRVSLFGVTTITKCQTLSSHEDSTVSANSVESPSQLQKIGIETYRKISRLSSLPKEVALDHDVGATSALLALAVGSDRTQVRGKVRQVSKSNIGGCLKRPQTSQLESSSIEIKAQSHLKFQALQQKHMLLSKRGDRRDSRTPLKAKHDSYSLKVDILSSSPACGGNSLFDITQQ